MMKHPDLEMAAKILAQANEMRLEFKFHDIGRADKMKVVVWVNSNHDEEGGTASSEEHFIGLFGRGLCPLAKKEVPSADL